MRLLNPTNTRALLLLSFLWAAILLSAANQPGLAAGDTSFTIAVIPDTQNYIDFRHQKAEGFEFDGSDLFIQQMRYVANRSVANGGDIAFVASVGDVWQHQTKTIDADHVRRGIDIEPDPIMARRAKRTEEVLTIELPKATEGYRIISEAGLPFAVGVEGTDSHQPVNALLALEIAVGHRPADRDAGAVDARLGVVVAVEQFGVEIVFLRPLNVHAQQHVGPIVGVGSAVAARNT